MGVKYQEITGGITGKITGKKSKITGKRFLLKALNNSILRIFAPCK